MLVGNLVCKEGSDDSKESRDKLVVAHDVQGDGRHGK